MMVIEDDNGIVRFFKFYFGLFPFREGKGTTLARSKNKAIEWTNFTCKLGWVFNSKSGYVHVMQLRFFEIKLPNLKLKIWLKHFLSYLQLDIALPST
jgi:hypothetical protein